MKQKTLGLYAPQNMSCIIVGIKVGLLLKSTLHGAADRIYLPEFWISPCSHTKKMDRPVIEYGYTDGDWALFINSWDQCK